MKTSKIDWSKFGPLAITPQLNDALRSSAHENGHIENLEAEWRADGIATDLVISSSEATYLATKKERMGL